MTIVEMCVHMDCQGCETKIKKALHRLEGVDEVDVDTARQKVTVTGWADQKKVLKAVRNTGRRAVLWPYPNNPADYATSSAQVYYNQTFPTQSVVGGGYHHHPACGPGSSSSYNYYKHGYDNSSVYGYYQRTGGSSIVDERARSLFSDENPNACSIM